MAKYKIKGTIARGLGEGAFFMSMQHYRREIKKKLGFQAYPGTLNIKADKKATNMLKNINAVKIKGYKSGKIAYGGANCYRAKIKNINGSVIVPDLTRHKGIIEFIAHVHLKSELKLKDGDKIEVELL